MEWPGNDTTNHTCLKCGSQAWWDLASLRWHGRPSAEVNVTQLYIHLLATLLITVTWLKCGSQAWWDLASLKCVVSLIK